jgi:hypothetical protein
MGNSGNASPEFTIVDPSSASAMTRGSSSSSDKVIAQKDSNGVDPIDPSQLPPDLPTTPVSPVTPVTPEPLSKDAPAPSFCRERNLASGEDPSERAAEP